MRRYLPVLLFALWPMLVAWSINPQGSSGAPVAVSTAAVEVAPCGQRNSLEICNQGSQSSNTVGSNLMFCANGPVTITPTNMTCGAAGTGGTFAPTSGGAGDIVFPGQCKNLNSPDNISWNGIQAEWDCACATTNGCNAYVVSAP